MDIKLDQGTYIVAVSGGVDSVVLLDLLSNSELRTPNSEFIVAHFDHGIRKDSKDDADFVKGLSAKYSLLFELGHGDLGEQASEALSREKRYAFLKEVLAKHKASAIITAHHQDDVIETSIINILRGTGRRGLTSLRSRGYIIRPLLKYPKSQLKDYALKNNLKWREDSTNIDIKHLRNYIRLKIVPKMDENKRQKWLSIVSSLENINQKIDSEIQKILPAGLHKNQLVLNRRWFTMLPHDIAKEIIITILSEADAEIDRKTVERLTIQIKTLPSGKLLQATGVNVYLTKRNARFKIR